MVPFVPCDKESRYVWAEGNFVLAKELLTLKSSNEFSEKEEPRDGLMCTELDDGHGGRDRAWSKKGVHSVTADLKAAYENVIG